MKIIWFVNVSEVYRYRAVDVAGASPLFMWQHIVADVTNKRGALLKISEKSREFLISQLWLIRLWNSSQFYHRFVIDRCQEEHDIRYFGEANFTTGAANVLIALKSRPRLGNAMRNEEKSLKSRKAVSKKPSNHLDRNRFPQVLFSYSPTSIFREKKIA